MAKNEQMGAERDASKGECKEEKKPARMKELLGKIAKPLAEGIAVVATAAVLSMPSCALDLDGEGKFRNDADVQEEQVEDPAAENEDMEDVVDMSEDAADEDVTDAPADLSEEDVGVEDVPAEEAEDTIEEDPAAEDAVEEDVSVEDVEVEDIVADSEGDMGVVCEPETASATVYITAGGSSTIGNITIEYGGVDTSGNGIYRILCEGSVVDTLNIPEMGNDTAGLPGGGSVRIDVNTVRAWGSNVFVTVSAP